MSIEKVDIIVLLFLLCNVCINYIVLMRILLMRILC